MEFITGENDRGRRLDRILRKTLADYPLTLIHRLLRKGQVLVNGKPAKAQDRLESGVIISIPELKKSNDDEKTPKVRRFPPPEILWEGNGLIAVNKPCGLSVHGPNSLDTKVRAYLADKLPPSLSFLPGPLHRLDKPSSGIVVFSAGIDGARLFSDLMSGRKIKKTYLAIVEGSLKKEEKWEDNLTRDKVRKKTYISLSDSDSGKNAVTNVKPLAVNKTHSFVMAEIATGRTHQIRAQAAFHGYPLAGDRKYGGHGKNGLFLHAWKLEFLEYSIEAPLPQAFKDMLKEIFGTLHFPLFLI